MGSRPAEFLLGRDRGRGQAVPHPGDGLHASPGNGPQAKNPHAPGRPRPGDQTGARSQAHPRLVSLNHFVTAIMSRVTLLPGSPTPLTLALEAAGGRFGLKNSGRVSLSLLLASLSDT